MGQPPGVSFAPDGLHLLYTEFFGDSLVLRRIRTDGEGKTLLYVFPHAVTAVVSPDLSWIAFREYHRSFVTPFAFAGRPVTISAFDRQGPAFRADSSDGAYLGWSRDGTRLHWTRGTGFYEKPVADIAATRGAPARTELSFDFPVALPSGTIALTNARLLTMDATRRVIDRATIIVSRNRITAVGAGVPVPAGAHVIDLTGKTVMPGMIDAHAHYNPALSSLHTVEQRHNGLLANLAYGTTTLYEVYGNVHKDFLVSDLQRSGAIPGARLFSTGNPIYGMRTFRPKLFRPIQSFADAVEIVRFNKDHGATALKDYVHFGRAARQQLYEAARAHGLNVVAETAVDPPMNMTMLLDGVSGLEHTIGLTPLHDDVVRLWAATGAGTTPTLIVSYNGPAGETFFRQGERLWDDPKVLHFFRRDAMLAGRRPTHYFEDDIYAVDMASELRKLAAAGVSLQGSGHGQQHGLDKHWELELFVKGGFSPMEALSFATIQSAQYLGDGRAARLRRDREARGPGDPRRRSARRHPQLPTDRSGDAQRGALQRKGCLAVVPRSTAGAPHVLPALADAAPRRRSPSRSPQEEIHVALPPPVRWRHRHRAVADGGRARGTRAAGGRAGRSVACRDRPRRDRAGD